VAGVAVSCVPPCSREPRGRSPSVRADVPDARKAAVWRVFSAVRDVPPSRRAAASACARVGVGLRALLLLAAAHRGR